jgi:hypothetical protein
MVPPFCMGARARKGTTMDTRLSKERVREIAAQLDSKVLQMLHGAICEVPENYTALCVTPSRGMANFTALFPSALGDAPTA